MDDPHEGMVSVRLATSASGSKFGMSLTVDMVMSVGRWYVGTAGGGDAPS